ncbi:alpha/beta hydrolase family esterase [Ponticaulis profundi]|uniref:Alpha/beta hydrolase family esterase n=1 Tax=Ponticaulis profundi TaxID=2665222 RepID=A0ABW1S609_9PROT
MLRRVCLLLTLMAALCAPGALAGGVPMMGGIPSMMYVNTDGTPRKVLIEAPLRRLEGDLPLAMIFHGGGGSADQMQAQSQALTRQLRAKGYLVVYLNGSARWGRRNLRTWNADHCCAFAEREHVDDAAYVNAVLESLMKRVPIDTDRIALIGHSNGAMLAYRLAAQLEHAPSHVVAISGAMFEDQPSLPAETSVLAIHARNDDVINFEGSGGKFERWRTAPNLSFAEVEERLLALKSCSEPTVHRPAGGVRQMQAACECGSGVETIVSARGGHEWPKAIPSFDLDAAIVRFLTSQPSGR